MEISQLYGMYKKDIMSAGRFQTSNMSVTGTTSLHNKVYSYQAVP